MVLKLFIFKNISLNNIFQLGVGTCLVATPTRSERLLAWGRQLFLESQLI